ncbi:MAG: ABC transporter ATP-binding protein [Armatimonadota bacterium]
MPGKTLVEVDNLKKRFNVRHEKWTSLKRSLLRLFRPYPHEAFWALKGVSLTIEAGDLIGVVGVNGSGKSTLLRIIGGIYVPTEGSINIHAPVSSLFELETGFNPQLTGYENVFLSGSLMGYSGREIQQAMPEVEAMSELEEFLEIPVKLYSSGMRFRLGFGIAMSFEPQILLVDEVLAAADEAFQRTAYRKLRNFQQKGAAVVLVSHELDKVREHCDRVIWLEEGRILRDGKTDEVLDAYLKEINLENTGGQNGD